MNKTKYPIVFQAPNTDIYDKVIEYINKVFRWDDSHREKNRVNYYLEGELEKKIRATFSKRKIELTSTVDEEIINNLKKLINQN